MHYKTDRREKHGAKPPVPRHGRLGASGENLVREPSRCSAQLLMLRTRLSSLAPADYCFRDKSRSQLGTTAVAERSFLQRLIGD